MLNQFTPSDVLQIGISVVILVGWFIRLESKVMYQSKEITRLEKKSGELEALVLKDLNEVKVNLAEIKGFLYRKTNQNHLEGIHIP